MGTTCAKCGYSRQPSDIAPDYECPKCGVIYAKTKRGEGTAQSIPTAWMGADDVEAPPPERTYASTLLIDCEACGAQISHVAANCQKCGHPNPSAPARAGNAAGVIAVAVAVSALWMPYFAAPLLIPAAIAATVIAHFLRAQIPWIIIAAILTAFASYNTYKTSQEIKELANEAQKQSAKAAHELNEFQRRLQIESERSKRDLDNAMRQFNR